MNQNLAKLGQQLLQIWKQLGLNQRISISLATLGVVLGTGGLLFWSSRVPHSLLYARLAEGESARVIAALDEAKVPYTLGAGGTSIYVPSDKVDATRMQLAGRGIPRGEGVGFEIFDKSNFGISDFVQRANYLRALQGELGRAIRKLDGVETATVMVVMPENRLLADKDRHPTASVVLTLRGGAPLSTSALNSIRFLVANAVEGLRPNHVTIVDNLGNSHIQNADDESLAGVTASQLAARRELESYLSKKAEGMLETVLGPGQAVVRVSAELNLETVSRVEEKFDPEGQVIRSQTRNDENLDSTSGDNANPVGLSANTPGESNVVAQATGPANNTKNRKVLGTTEYEIGKTTSNTYTSPGGIRRISSAVTVAARMEGTGTERKMVPRTPEELEKLRRVVQNALGYEVTRGDQVIVEEMPFNDQYATEMNKRFEMQQREDFWWRVARLALYPGLAAVMLLVFLRLLKRTPVEDLALPIPIGMFPGMGDGHGHVNGNGNGNGKAHANGNGNGNGHARPGRPGAGGGPGDWFGEPRVVTVEVLNQLVKENPANLTGAIRAWLGRDTPPPSR